MVRPQKATQLSEVFDVFKPTPLVDPEDVQAFYRDGINKVRSSISIRKRFAQALNQSHGKAFYKGLMMGPPGVGKTTELHQLAQDIKEKYYCVIFKASVSLDTQNFKATDILLLMMTLLVDQLKVSKKDGGIDQVPDVQLLEDIWAWFASEKETLQDKTLVGFDMGLGVNIKPDQLWAKLLGLFAHLKGEFKFSASRSKEVEHYRLNRLDELVRLMNRLIDKCNTFLKQQTQQEILFIGDDFEKSNIPFERVKEFFIDNGGIIQSLNSHLLFTIPMDLAARAAQLPIASDQILMIAEAPVYEPDFTPNDKARQALQEIIEARLDLNLLAPGQLERLIVASGGILRVLFTLMNRAVSTALLQDPPRSVIEVDDLDESIQFVCNEFERALAPVRLDPQGFTQEVRIKRLVEIYQKDPKAQTPDELYYFLLQRQLVVESNGKRRGSVHPIVVNILATFGDIQPNPQGVISGGLI